MAFIEFDKLERGAIYRIRSRNLIAGVFNGRGFIGIRQKFGNKYLDEEIEYSQSRNFGTARAVAKIGVVPEGVPLVATMAPECSVCGKPIKQDGARAEGRVHADDSELCEKGYGVIAQNQDLYAVLEPYEENANRGDYEASA